jgi:hypothetical protein
MEGDMEEAMVEDMEAALGPDMDHLEEDWVCMEDKEIQIVLCKKVCNFWILLDL